jgi:hypothetical protein
MTIFEVAESLPNGFHDSELSTVSIDYSKRSVQLALDVWIGTMSDPPSTRETYRAGVLSINGLKYCAIDVPDQRYPYAQPDAVTIDLAEATQFLPGAASFACRLWVNDWNGFIHIAAESAQFVWVGEPTNRHGA